jgi:hypothetical protein
MEGGICKEIVNLVEINQNSIIHFLFNTGHFLHLFYTLPGSWTLVESFPFSADVSK